MVNLLNSAITLSLLAWTVSGKAISIDIARKHRPSLKQAAAAAYERATQPQPKGNSLAAGEAPTLSLLNAQFSYYMAIGLGTPIQNFSVVVDTGSSLLWVPDQSCRSSCVSAPGSFKSTQSSTFQQDNSTALQAYYGSGNAQGIMGMDTLSFNGGAFQVKNQEFGLATTQSHVTNNGVDGIIGLGPDALSRYSNSQRKVIKTAITNIVEQNADLSNVFGVKFQPVPTGYYSSMNGLIALGGLPDPSWYDGKINWIPRINTTRAADFWGVAVDSVNFGNTAVISSLSAIVDTGTTLIIVSNTIANALYANIPGAAIDPYSDLWSIPCSAVSTLPTIAFIMNGISFQLTPSQYILPKYLNPYWGAQKTNLCLSFIYSADMSSAGYDILLGQKFLENYVSIYDADHDRIGLAPNTQTTPKTTTTKSTTKKTTTTKSANTKTYSSPASTPTSVTCKQYKVQSGDKCYQIKDKFGITAKQFYSYNPGIKTDCSNIASFVGIYVCVGPPTTAAAAASKATTTTH